MQIQICVDCHAPSISIETKPFERKHKTILDKITGNDVARFFAKIDRRGPRECWEWQAGVNHDNYGLFKIGKINYRAHRVVYELFNGAIEPGKLLRHTCDNPRCCNPHHLLTGTDADNRRDAQLRGRAAKKLTPDDVREIRLELARGQSQRDIAARYGVTHKLVWNIHHNLYWDHIT